MPKLLKPTLGTLPEKKRHSLYLSDFVFELLLQIGKGNASLGVELAAITQAALVPASALLKRKQKQ